MKKNIHTIVEITQNNQVILNKNILKEIEVMFDINYVVNYQMIG